MVAVGNNVLRVKPLPQSTLKDKVVLDIEGDPGCSFCKAPRSIRAYMFCNDQQDCFMCDICIVALHTSLVDLNDPDPYRPQGRPN